MTYSQEEIARRHRAVKELLKQLDLPAAVIFSRDGVMKSWLYGERTHGYDGAGDILIADGPSYCVSEEFLHFRMLDPAEDLTPFICPTNYQAVQKASRFSCAPILQAMERKENHRLGLYRPDEMNVQTEQYLRQYISGRVQMRGGILFFCLGVTPELVPHPFQVWSY